MTKICFVSYEIHPTVSGGCGVLLDNAAHVLLSQGHEVILLLDIAAKEFRRFDKVDRLSLPNPDACRAYRVEDLATGIKYRPRDFRSVFGFRTYRFHVAASQVYRLEKPDIIEFFEYCGVAYSALCAKVAGLDYQQAHIAVRLHSTLELIDRQQPGSIHGIDRYIMYGLEHHALRLAETVLYPSRAYLEDGYRPYYEAWFGEAIFSKPPLVHTPKRASASPDANAILFYGRLHGIKGVDTFVDAAVLYLSDERNLRRHFYLVGYDSYSPPGSRGSYQDYLWRKIPHKFREYFHFTGQLTWKELGKLLPDVLFAVIPSHLESFCYAAHELYEVGIPLIVSDLPAFRDYFQHERNALVFDGTVSGLAQQIKRLSDDGDLRRRLARPYALTQNALGGFYDHPSHSGWINVQGATDSPSMLVCILCDQPAALDATLQSLARAKLARAEYGGLPEHIEIVLLYPVQQEPGSSLLAVQNRRKERLELDEGDGVQPADEDDPVVSWFLGKAYRFADEQGKPVYPTQVFTGETLLILKAGDVLEPNYLSIGLSILGRQPQLSFVCSWKRVESGHSTSEGESFRIETFQLDAALELMPFISSSPFSRAIMRTPVGKLLVDLFDPRSGRLGEQAYLWGLDTEASCGLMLPEVYLTQTDEDERILDTNAVDYLIIRDHNPWRKRRFARYPLSLANRSFALREHFVVEPLDPDETAADTLSLATQELPRGTAGGGWVDRLKSTRLNRWLDHLPWLKRLAKRVVERLFKK